MNNPDLEYTNRHNFQAMMNALSRPGSKQPITPLFDSGMLALANALLYSEVGVYLKSSEDFHLIRSITNFQSVGLGIADYVFLDEEDNIILQEVKIGDHVNPDNSAILIIHAGSETTEVIISGAGIDGSDTVHLPCSPAFIAEITDTNAQYPLGCEIIFIYKDSIQAISRATQLEIV